jgi:hypothetical protein
MGTKDVSSLLSKRQRMLLGVTGVTILVLAVFTSSVLSNAFLSRDRLQSNPQSDAGTKTVQQITAGGRTASVSRQDSLSAVAVTSIRNLDAESWLESLEIEIKNISNRPVFCVVVVLDFPGLKAKGPDGAQYPEGILLTYGRMELLKKGNLANANDKEIKPGESHVLTIPEDIRKRLETDLATAGLQVKKFYITVDSVIFEDGSGFSSGRYHAKPQQSRLAEP